MSMAVPPFPDEGELDRPADNASPGELGALLSITTTRPDAATVLLRLAGEIDEHTVVRLEEALAPRLQTALHRIVIDLSNVEFLGVTGLQLLNQSRLRADDRGIALCVVATNHAVLRALQVAELDEPLLAATLQQALQAHPGACCNAQLETSQQ